MNLINQRKNDTMRILAIIPVLILIGAILGFLPLLIIIIGVGWHLYDKHKKEEDEWDRFVARNRRLERLRNTTNEFRGKFRKLSPEKQELVSDIARNTHLNYCENKLQKNDKPTVKKVTAKKPSITTTSTRKSTKKFM